MTPRVRPAGDRAVLVELDDNTEACALAHAARRDLAGVAEDVVGGHRTVLVSWAPGRERPSVDWPALLARGSGAGADVRAAAVALPVVYDGPDLADVAALAGCSTEEVARRHCAAAYTVAFVGFAPGFAYLVGGDPTLAVARRAEPRPSVPAGSVALGGPYTAAYPRPSPGGWQLIGRTPATLFDERRDPPALLRPGVPVRICDITGPR
jgi:KipI family sensor histidine kinase inhibitor